MLLPAYHARRAATGMPKRLHRASILHEAFFTRHFARGKYPARMPQWSSVNPPASAVTLAPPAKNRLSYAWRALKHRNFRLFFSGQTISPMGTWMTRLATS